MLKRRLLTCLATLTLGLAAFAWMPGEAEAAQVQCSNDFGECTVGNDPDWISCMCSDESGTAGSGGDEFANFTEEQLMEVCLMELEFCALMGETDSETTFGTSTSTSGDTEGTTGDTEGTSTSTSGDTEGTSTSGDTEGTGTSGDTEGTGTSGDSGDATGGDSGTGTEGGETGGGETGGGETGEGSGGESGTDSGGESEGGQEEAEGGDESEGEGEGAGADEGEGCSVANNSGAGLLALFGVFGLLGFRSRRRAA